jgi:hypothetical protein
VIVASFAIGAVWYSPVFGVNYLFEQRSLEHQLINGGYNVVTFTVLGEILGVL